MTPRKWLGCLLILYSIACALPAMGRLHGFLCLISFPHALLVPAWWANPMFFAGCIALAGRNTKVATVLGDIASALAMSISVVSPVRGLQVGSTFWFVCMFGLAGSGLIPPPEGFDKPAMIPEMPGEETVY